MSGKPVHYIVTVTRESKVDVLADSPSAAESEALEQVALVGRSALPATALIEQNTSVTDIIEKGVNRIDVQQDECCDSPFDGGYGWKMYSFSRRRGGEFKDYGSMRGEDGQSWSDEWKERFRNGTAVLLSCYEHSGCSWRLCNGRMIDRWDDTVMAGVLVWEEKEELVGTPESRRADAARCIEEYNAWSCGDCWGYRNKDGDDVFLGGYVGIDFLIEALASDLGEAFDRLQFIGEHAKTVQYAYEEFRRKREKAKAEGEQARSEFAQRG